MYLESYEPKQTKIKYEACLQDINPKHYPIE